MLQLLCCNLRVDSSMEVVVVVYRVVVEGNTVHPVGTTSRVSSIVLLFSFFKKKLLSLLSLLVFPLPHHRFSGALPCTRGSGKKTI